MPRLVEEEWNTGLFLRKKCSDLRLCLMKQDNITMSSKLVVAQPIHNNVLSYLEQHADVEMNPGPEPYGRRELIEKCADAHGVMVFMTERIDPQFLETCKNMKVISGALKGYNNINVYECSRQNIPVTIVPDLLSEPTGELTIGLMLSLARKVCAGDRYIRGGNFSGWRPTFYGQSLSKANVLVIGAGAVGKTVLRMLKGFGCKCSYVDTVRLSGEEEIELACSPTELKEGLPNADFVVLALHLMPETRHLVDEVFLSKMKKSSFLINPARGSLVDEKAVEAALLEQKIAGYAADTFEVEDWTIPDRPRSISPALLGLENTVFTPHIGSAVRDVREAIEFSAAKSLVDGINGKIPENTVNAKHLREVR